MRISYPNSICMHSAFIVFNVQYILCFLRITTSNVPSTLNEQLASLQINNFGLRIRFAYKILFNFLVWQCRCCSENLKRLATSLRINYVRFQFMFFFIFIFVVICFHRFFFFDSVTIRFPLMQKVSHKNNDSDGIPNTNTLNVFFIHFNSFWIVCSVHIVFTNKRPQIIGIRLLCVFLGSVEIILCKEFESIASNATTKTLHKNLSQSQTITQKDNNAANVFETINISHSFTKATNRRPTAQ